MALGFVSTTKQGQHFELAKFSLSKLKTANLALKGRVNSSYLLPDTISITYI